MSTWMYPDDVREGTEAPAPITVGIDVAAPRYGFGPDEYRAIVRVGGVAVMERRYPNETRHGDYDHDSIAEIGEKAMAEFGFALKRIFAAQGEPPVED